MASACRALTLCLLCALPRLASADGVVLSEPPDQPDKAAHYIFYLHGKIIEDQGPRPTHPRWGIYEYDAVLAALGRGGAVVISERRPAGTRVGAYAAKIATQVQGLLQRGVPASHIGVVGFSKGGAIAQAVSARLQADIRYGLLASCGKSGKGPPLHGFVLSLREQSDSLVGTCTTLLRASPEVRGHRESVIAIGGGHGAFYRPHEAWLAPLLRWLSANE